MNRLLFLIVSSMITGITWGANSLLMPLYLKDLGLTPLDIGTIIALSILFSAFMSLILSAYADAFGKVKGLTIQTSLSILGLILLIAGIPFGYLTLGGFGGGTIKMAMISDLSDNMERDLSRVNSGSILFSVIGSAMAGLLYPKYVFLIEIVLFLVSISLVVIVGEVGKPTGKFKLGITSKRTVFKFSTDSLIGLGAGMVIPLMSLWFYLKFGVGREELAPIYIISELTLAASSMLSPILSRKIGTVNTIFLTELVSILLLVYLPFTGSFILASAVYVVRNVLMNMTSPIREAFILRLIPREERTRGNGIVNMFHAIPRAIGPEIGGTLFNLGNLTLPFLITASLYSVSGLAFFLMFRKTSAKG